MSTIRIAMIEDFDSDIYLITQILTKQNDFELVCRYKNGKDFFEQVNHHAYDVLLLDINLPIMSGFEIINQMLRICPSKNIVVLSSTKNNYDIARLENSHITAYINKVRIHTLCEDLRFIFLHNAKTGYRFKTISDDELKLLHLFCTDLTFQQIADKMCLSKKAVENKLIKLCETKLHISAKRNHIINFCTDYGFKCIDCFEQYYEKHLK